MYQAREYIFQIRMLVSGCFRQSIPVAQTNVNFSRMDRDSAMKWIQQTYHTGTVLLTAITADDGNPGRQFMIDSPFVIFLYIGLVSRALDLWRLDKSLSLAREVAISSRRVFDWYQQIWPNAELQKWAANAFRDLDATGGTPRPQIP
ncbi:hypothetical protein FRB96_003250 [Tulasnella sp. 330]|nr:hypothetical protein FRB96_003250 [Tulasnella sp. 330]KAG8878918.1 hypothetical protein FRB97_002107 [Tulasnella sp. 331]